MISYLFAISMAFAGVEEGENCKETVTTKVTSNTLPAEGEVIGLSETCDNFGGIKYLTPKNKIVVYVNFNVGGQVNLNLIDRVFDRMILRTPAIVRNWILKKSFAILDQGTVTKWRGEQPGNVHWSRETLYIGSTNLDDESLEKAATDFYDFMLDVVKDYLPPQQQT